MTAQEQQEQLIAEFEAVIGAALQSVRDSLNEMANGISTAAQAFLDDFLRQWQAVGTAVTPTMHHLETQYPEILGEDGNWRPDWADIIRQKQATPVE